MAIATELLRKQAIALYEAGETNAAAIAREIGLDKITERQVQRWIKNISKSKSKGFSKPEQWLYKVRIVPEYGDSFFQLHVAVAYQGNLSKTHDRARKTAIAIQGLLVHNSPEMRAEVEEKIGSLEELISIREQLEGDWILDMFAPSKHKIIRCPTRQDMDLAAKEVDAIAVVEKL